MIYTLFGAGAGFILGCLFLTIRDRKKDPKKWENFVTDVMFGWADLLFVVMCGNIGGGLGFMYGSYQLSQGTHPISAFL